MSNAHITIYTRPLCIWYFRAKRLLRKHGFQFEERDARREDSTAATNITITGTCRTGVDFGVGVQP